MQAHGRRRWGLRRLVPALLVLALAGAKSAPAAGMSGVPAPPAAAPADPEQQLQVAAAATWQRNVHLRELVVYPSPAYYNPYLRDSFWTAQALGNRRLALHALAAFAAAERADGQPPTYFVNAYRRPVYHGDESAALLLIWAWRNHTLYDVTPPRQLLVRALRYLLWHAVRGYEAAPPGRYVSWWDAYALPGWDTLSYTQGLYAVALRCAAQMHLGVPPGVQTQAEAAYRALYDRRLGYLRLSRTIPASDASALSGEFLSLWLFNHAMLPDNVVRSTLRRLTPFGAGFRVVALPPGPESPDGYLPADPSGLGVPGDYQNGASWLLYDALSIAAAGLHGLPDALPRLRARLALEFSHGVVLHEYLRTQPDLPYYGTEPPYRDGFSWDTFVLVIDRLLHGHDAAGARGGR